MNGNETQNYESIMEFHTLDALPNILFMVDHDEPAYMAYAGEMILGSTGTVDIKGLCDLGEKYGLSGHASQGGCFYIASITLERPQTMMTMEQFIINITHSFVTFRKTLPTILGGAITKILTAAEIYEVLTGFPKESLEHVRENS